MYLSLFYYFIILFKYNNVIILNLIIFYLIKINIWIYIDTRYFKISYYQLYSICTLPICADSENRNNQLNIHYSQFRRIIWTRRGLQQYLSLNDMSLRHHFYPEDSSDVRYPWWDMGLDPRVTITYVRESALDFY
jgi:hypothetical protein